MILGRGRGRVPLCVFVRVSAACAFVLGGGVCVAEYVYHGYRDA